MMEPFIYDVSSVQERLIWGGAPEPSPSAAATAAVDNVSSLFTNDQPQSAPNTDDGKKHSTKNGSGKSKL